jgi:hypothetical protein
VRAVDVSAAANKVLVVLILCQGARACLPGDGVGAATARSRRYFVPPDLLLPWWIGSGSCRESGGKRLGVGRRRAPASSRGVLHWSGSRGLKVVVPALFLDAFDGMRRCHALRSDGVHPRPTSPKDEGSAACSGRLLRSTKELDSDGISSELGVRSVRLLLRRQCRRRRRLDLIWMCSRTCRAFFVILSFYWGLCASFLCMLFFWIFPDLATFVVLSKV